MAMQLSKDTEQRLKTSIKRFFKENLDLDIGDLKAALILDFCTQEMGPSFYNQAITDAQAYMQDRVMDMDGSCYKTEFGYWDS